MIPFSKLKNLRHFLFLFVLFIGSSLFVTATNTTKVDTTVASEKSQVNNSFSQHKNSGENEKCLQCHGQSKYSYFNKESKKKVTKRMYSELIMNRSVFYESNHREFKCIDCHSEEYIEFPHAGNLRMESKPNCLDCHGGDEKYAKYHFENIEKEFQSSVHSEKHSEDFTCWMCHNAHTYLITARTSENIKQTIAYDNAICMNCHSDFNKYQLLTDKQTPNLIKKHDWLPNQKLHFQSVRCIECHTKKINDSTLVGHNILPKKNAVKRCEECHSTNSVLMASLYRYKIKEIRSTQGFFRGILVNDSSVIGANRNFFLNIVSVLFASIVIVGLLIHALLRAIKK
jgi:hypothetical protein